ncbi:hypothetical protein [Candidatus Mycoplasma haematohominis]|uniref:Uncharacterized protein n=1 Tax=Candidatus Mycoplasma haematohominis TaxID=1494318 RepID=A0A478FQD3_9MOLU|nr:hypothetical protein [Candidatus Mycoplasma haemohominis]GCE63114.1 hypothetical protein MHSWG343_00920 [Candidatus Mycoplasma haemohominis]
MSLLKIVWSANKLSFLIAKLLAGGGTLIGLGYLGYTGTKAVIYWTKNSPEGKNIVGGIKSVVYAACKKIGGGEDINGCINQLKNKVTGSSKEEGKEATTTTEAGAPATTTARQATE